MGPLVLASRSPRRAELLRAAGIAFQVRAFPEVDETVPAGVTRPEAIVVLLAARKARAAAERAPHERILAADTLVFLEGEILGKPRDADDARRMLRALSGRAHLVATGVALAVADGAGGSTVQTGVDVTRVVFRTLLADEIAAYVDGGEPLDKAGAYALQGTGRSFVSALEGEEDTVIGLPLSVVRRLLR